jgi:hypothetical protein
MSYPRIHQSKLISTIDLLVRDVLFGDIDISQISVQLSKLYLPLLDDYDSTLKYAQTVEAFKHSAEKVMADPHSQNNRWGYYNTIQFINYLGNHEALITDEDAKRIKQEKSNSKSLEANLRKLFSEEDGLSRLLFVRVDLFYLKGTMHLVTIADLHRHINKLREFIGNKKTCFEDLVDHAIAIEQGHEHGYHCHVLLIYNGAERQRDTYLGQAVGEKWENITDGLGSYYNCNHPANKRAYEESGTLGIGMISRHDEQAVENAIRTALYPLTPVRLTAILTGLTSISRSNYLKCKPLLVGLLKIGRKRRSIPL